MILSEETLKTYVKIVTSKRHKSYFPELINEISLTAGSEVSSIESCDLSDIEGGKAWNMLTSYINEKRVNSLNSEIKELRSKINNPISGTTDAEMQLLYNQLEEKEFKMSDITAEYFGILGGALTQGFQNNLIELLNFGSIIFLGPVQGTVCRLIKSLVKVINAALGIFTEKTPRDKRRDKEDQVTEFDNVYRALESLYRKFAAKYKKSSNQIHIYEEAISDLGLYPNEEIMAKVVFVGYIRFLKKDRPTGNLDARDAEKLNQINEAKDKIKNDDKGQRKLLINEGLKKAKDREDFTKIFNAWFRKSGISLDTRDIITFSDSIKFTNKDDSERNKIYDRLKKDMLNNLAFNI
jgi:ribosomal protein L20A (L18A)